MSLVESINFFLAVLYMENIYERLLTSYDHCLQDLCRLTLCRVLSLPQGLHDIFCTNRVFPIQWLTATIVFFFFPCCHFSTVSNVSQCFSLPNNGVLWCLLCLTCLWSSCFNPSVSMRFGFLSFTLSCRLAP